MKIYEIYKEDSKGYRSEPILVRKLKKAKIIFKAEVRKEIKEAGEYFKQIIKLNSKIYSGRGRKKIVLIDSWDNEAPEEESNKGVTLIMREVEVI